MKQKTTLSVPKPCDQKWSEMTPNQEGRHCDSCNTTLLDFSVLSDAQIIEVLKRSGPVCVKVKNSQLDRPLQHYTPQNTASFNLRAVAMGLGMLITLPSYASDRTAMNSDFDLIEILRENGNEQLKNQENRKINIVVLNARNGIPLSQMKVLFLDQNKRKIFHSFTNEEGILSVNTKKLERKNIQFVLVDTNEMFTSTEIPFTANDSDLIIKLERSYQGEQYITIGMVEYDNLD